MNELKGSDKRSKAQKEELLRTMAEFTEKLNDDPYQPGITHPNLCADDIQDIIEDVMWVRDFTEITIKIKKEDTDSTISVEVLERKK
jgi:hypothetical protein